MRSTAPIEGDSMDAATRDLWTQRALALVLLADQHPGELPAAARALFEDIRDERDVATIGEVFGRVTVTLLGVATHLADGARDTAPDTDPLDPLRSAILQLAAGRMPGAPEEPGAAAGRSVAELLRSSAASRALSRVIRADAARARASSRALRETTAG